MPTASTFERLVDRLVPGSRIVDVQGLQPDDGEDGTKKAFGYGEPVRIRLRDASGRERSLVLHTEKPNAFGHERRADRWRDLVLAYDTQRRVPRHVEVLDIGFVAETGDLTPLGRAGEPYLVTSYAEGGVYAEELRRIAAAGEATEVDVARATGLADYLAELHAIKRHDRIAYRRSIRDLVGQGEGVFGIVDGYPDDTPHASPARLESLERRIHEWRWILRRKEHRLSRTHGDFHPFNLVFEPDGSLAVLDASRGCEGDPADDVTALAINYVFFALESPGTWEPAFSRLWKTFFARYLSRTRDEELLVVAPPFLAWRALVVANPLFYPSLRPETRDALLTLAETALDRGRFDPWEVEALFR